MCHRFAIVIASLFAFAASVGCTATPPTESKVDDVNYEGLLTVPSKAFDIAQVRPNTDFRKYTRLQVGEPELAFRSANRAQQELKLSTEQADRFRQGLVAAFDAEFAQLRSLELTDQPGPAVLTLDIRVEDIVVTVAPSSVGRVGRAAALLEASGAAVVVVELRDSQSNEILARGVHADMAKGGALRTEDRQVRTRFESAEKIVAAWATKARAGIDNLLDERR